MKQYEIRSVKIAQIEPNPWNPNVQADAVFNRLTEELDDEGGEGVGYIDLIQLVQLPDDEHGERYRIIGGEHRWRALMTLGVEEVDAVILIDPKWQDEDLQKFVTMRLNAIKGKIDPTRFMALYEDLAERHSAEDLQKHFAVMDDKAWSRLTKDARKALKSATEGDPEKSKKALADFDKKAKTAKTADDLSSAISQILSKFAESEDQPPAVVTVSTSGGKHLHLSVAPGDWPYIEMMVDKAEEDGMSPADLLLVMIQAHLSQ